jgi:hypothetical protein
MSHEPPIPPESSSPYPLQPPPTRKKAKRKQQQPRAAKTPAEPSTNGQDERGTALVVVDSPEAQGDAASSERTSPIIGVGAAVALGAAAAVTGLFYAKRRSAAADKAKRTSQSSTKRTGDDKAKRGGADRRRVAAGQPYEVSYFARKHGLSAADARAIIKQAGNDRDRANQLAGQRKEAGK